MSKPHRLIAAGAVISALAVAGPVASAGAAQAAAAAPTATPGSSVPCYPFPAFCDPTTDKPASWAPSWVWPALGLQPPQGYPTSAPLPITAHPITFPLITGAPASK